MIMGIRFLLEDETDFVICGSADNADDAMEWIPVYTPEIVILDISIKGTVDGIALAEMLKDAYPHIIILMLSMHDEATYGPRAMSAGASGYLNKSDAPELLVKALRHIIDGEDFFTAERVREHLRIA